MNMPFFAFPKALSEASDEAMRAAAPAFARIDEITEYNQQKVLAAFIQNRVSESHFAASTGYGYGDRGRDTLDRVFAQVMGAEDALVRHFLVSGTHAITVALFGVLRPGDVLLAATGAPYDTLRGVIGIDTPADGSLAEYGIGYREIPLCGSGVPDTAAIRRALQEDPCIKAVHIQRSCGYSLRPSLSVEQIKQVVRTVREIRPDAVIFTDNCYGEFVQTCEPTSVGVDLMAGSLIKNAGGGIAENGGYICGKTDLVERCAHRMTTPGLGREVGASLGHNRSLFMGLFQAPHVTGEALKTAVYASALFEKLGFAVTPKYNEPRADIIQAIQLGSPEALAVFCRGIQQGAPVDSFVAPEAWDMPGYGDPVIMSAGTFTAGASIELSADAPVRPPYAVYMQGGLNFHSAKVGVLSAALALYEQGQLPALKSPSP